MVGARIGAVLVVDKAPVGVVAAQTLPGKQWALRQLGQLVLAGHHAPRQRRQHRPKLSRQNNLLQNKTLHQDQTMLNLKIDADRNVVRWVQKQFTLWVILQQGAVLEDERLIIEWLDAVRCSVLQKKNNLNGHTDNDCVNKNDVRGTTSPAPLVTSSRAAAPPSPACAAPGRICVRSSCRCR